MISLKIVGDRRTIFMKVAFGVFIFRAKTANVCEFAVSGKPEGNDMREGASLAANRFISLSREGEAALHEYLPSITFSWEIYIFDGRESASTT